MLPVENRNNEICFLLFKKQNIPKFKGSCRRFMKDGEFQVEELLEMAQKIEDKCTVETEDED